VTVKWQRLNYLVHRWLGIALGVLVFVWFASGIVMIYYPWPAPTLSQEFARLQAFDVPPGAIGFAAAHRAALAALDRLPSVRHDGGGGGPDRLVGGRLEQWNGHAAYILWRQHTYIDQPTVVVDAMTGTVRSPISDSDAVATARSAVGVLPAATRVELLAEGDHYLMSSEYQPSFPAYRVDFDDPDNTAVYVGQAGANIVGVVTTLTRWTTWLGTVPHWLYFKWLYSRHLTLWLWVSYVLPAIAAAGGLAGILLGVYQLFPRRRRGEWRISPYRGMSQWHHIAGIVFGVLVITWAVSGVLEVLGPENFPEGPQVTRVRGAVQWDAIRISEADAARRLKDAIKSSVLPIAIDLTTLDGHLGYVFHLEGDRTWWVDAASGVPRGELNGETAQAIAREALGSTVPVEHSERITQYDAYYYARPYRQMPLPVWRIAFRDPQRSTLYLDPVSGRPVGFVFRESRTYRWLRDGLHTFDIPAINGKRPLWDLALGLPMLGGTVIAFTGVWLLIRRLVRMT